MNRRTAILTAAAAVLGSQLPGVEPPVLHGTMQNWEHAYEVIHFTESGKRITQFLPKAKVKEACMQCEIGGERIVATYFQWPLPLASPPAVP
jgi:hypothetical protein